MPRPSPLTSPCRLFYSLDFGHSRLSSACFGHLRAHSTSTYFGSVHLVHQSVSLTATCASLCSHIKPYHHIRQYPVQAWPKYCVLPAVLAAFLFTRTFNQPTRFFDSSLTAVQVVRCRDAHQPLYCCRLSNITMLVAAKTYYGTFVRIFDCQQLPT